MCGVCAVDWGGGGVVMLHACMYNGRGPHGDVVCMWVCLCSGLSAGVERQVAGRAGAAAEAENCLLRAHQQGLEGAETLDGISHGELPRHSQGDCGLAWPILIDSGSGRAVDA